MKKIFPTILAIVICMTTLFNSISAMAASWPSLSSSAYCEFTAQKKINVYKDSSCSTRGTSSPKKSYDAYVAKGDVCKIYEITSKYIKLSYPTSSGSRTGYIKRGSLFDVSSPSESVTSKGKATTYTKPDGSSYGYTEKGDQIFKCGSDGDYTIIIYTAKSGKRAFKLGYTKTSDYNKIIRDGSSKSSSSSTLLFPLEGAIAVSSSATTNGYNCDYKTGGVVPVYAPADGKVTYKQAYRGSVNNWKLSSYGNFIEFVTTDGVYKIKCCHLSEFNGVTLKIKKSLAYPCSGSDGVMTLATKNVKQGELLGYTGSTGNASGNHLHLEVYKNGSAVNPKSVFTTW